MNRNHQLRMPALHRIALVFAVAMTLVVSRSVAISSSRASLSHKATVQCQTTHPRRQALDWDAGFQFSLIARNALIVPPATCSQSQPCTVDAVLLPEPGTYLHNRPPPLS